MDQKDQTDQINKTDLTTVSSEDSVRDAHADQKHGEQDQPRDQPPQMTMRFRSLVMPMHVPRNFKIVRMS
jgi:hypothetical protein